MTQKKQLLGQMLLQRRLISERELDELLAEQAVRKVRLAELIYEKNLIAKDELIRAVEETMHCKFYVAEHLRPEPAVLRLVPREMAMKHHCIPIRLVDKCLEVIFAEPQDLAALNELSFATGLRIVPFMDFRASIEAAIERSYKEDGQGSAARSDGTDLEFISASTRQAHKDALRELQANQSGQETAAVRLVSKILSSAFLKGASDIHIEQHSEEVVVRLRVDGVLHELQRFADELRAQLVSRIKILADLDISERRVPQDGRFVSRRRNERYDIRVSTLPTQYGEKVVMRILDPNAAKVPFEKLGLSLQDSQNLTRQVHKPQGMVLVTGPTGSGKSTTLYAALNLIHSSAINITTIEDPIEYMLEGANQVQVNPKAGRTFSGCLRSVLRQDPDVVMVGEIRDPETAEIALTAAQTGHLIFSTLHTNDSISAISRLIDLEVPPFFIASSVNAIIAQRLVRRLCSCRIATPEVDELHCDLRNMGFDHAPLVAYYPKGCGECNGTGYRGRVGVYEVLLIDDSMRQAIRNNMRDEVLRDYAISAGMRLMVEDAVSKVLQGLTTVDEILRLVPHVKHVNHVCLHCRSALNPRFRFCPICGAASPDDIAATGEVYENKQPLSRPM